MRHLSLLILSLCSIFTFSQEPSFNWFNPSSIEGVPAYWKGFVGETTQNYYSLRHNSLNEPTYATTFSLVITSKETKTSKTISIASNPTPSEYQSTILNMFTIGEDIFALRKTRYNKEKKLNLVLSKLDLNGKFKDDKIISEHIFNSSLFPGDYSSILSPDKSKLLIIRMPDYDKKKLTYDINLICYEMATWSILYSEPLSLEIPSQKDPTLQLKVNNQGDAIFGYYHKLDKEFRNDFFGYNYAKKSFANIPIDLKMGKNGRRYSIEILKDNGFSIVGSYFDDKIEKGIAGTPSSQVHGVFTALVKNGNELVNNAFYPWTKELINFQFNDANRIDNITDFEGEDITGHHVLDNGNVVLEIASNYVITQTMGSGEGSYKVYSLKYKMLKMWAFNPTTGEIIWNRLHRIPQEWQQKSADPGAPFFGQLSFTINNKIYYIYNNQAASRDWKEHDGTTFNRLEEFGKFASSAPFMYIINENGEIQYSEMAYGLPLRSIFKKLTGAAVILDASCIEKVNDGFLIRNFTYNRVLFTFGLMKIN